MGLVTDFVPIVDGVVEKALKETGKTDEEINDLKDKIKNIFQTDKSVETKINDLVKEESKTLPLSAKEEAKTLPLSAKEEAKTVEPSEPLLGLRTAIRPAITLALTVTFIFLVVFPLVSPYEGDEDLWLKVFSPFMAVFNLLLGFWFGERSALKVPGGEQAKKVAAEVRKEAREDAAEVRKEAREDAAKAPAKAKTNNTNAQG
jgi:hypothetical protein